MVEPRPQQNYKWYMDLSIRAAQDCSKVCLYFHFWNKAMREKRLSQGKLFAEEPLLRVLYLQNGSLFKEIISPGVFVAGLSSLNARATLCLESRRDSRRVLLCTVSRNSRNPRARACIMHKRRRTNFAVLLCTLRGAQWDQAVIVLCSSVPAQSTSSLLRFCGCTYQRVCARCVFERWTKIRARTHSQALHNSANIHWAGAPLRRPTRSCSFLAER